MIAAIIFGVLSLLGTIVTTVQALTTRAFRRTRRPFSPRAGSFVSILKPVCGLDDELEENLRSFTRLEGIAYEVIISVEEWDDPALEVVRRVMREHPDAPFRLVVDGGTQHGVVNRKIERLIAATRAAKGQIFLISDSNVRVEPDDVARTLAAFENPRVGCVSNVFTGAGAQTFGSTIESLHLLTFVAPGAVLADRTGFACVVGKSMAITRRAHDAIGGFARFRFVLAEDQAIGLAVQKAGYDVALSPVVVRNVTVTRTLRRALDRQIRWNKIRYAFSKSLYASELLLNPLPLAIVAALFAPQMIAFPLFVLAARWLQIALLDRALDTRMTWAQLAMAPLLDALMLYTWLVALFSNEVTWRGHRARIGRGTEMIQAAA